MNATPECSYCGTKEGLRQIHDGGGYEAPEYTCAGCFTTSYTGPCFDDLPEARTQQDQTANVGKVVSDVGQLPSGAEKSSHTPAGNWRAYESAGFKGEWGVETDDPAMVEAGDEIIVYPSLSEEHACLIAAAPDLLAAIVESRKQLDCIIEDGIPTDFLAWREDLDAVIAKASRP